MFRRLGSRLGRRIDRSRAAIFRARFRIAGFVAGAVLQLVLMGFVSVAFNGGLSDGSQARPPVYIIE